MIEPLATALRHFASLGNSLRQVDHAIPPPTRSFADAFAKLIPAVESLRDSEFRELNEISRQSREQLRPLGEPLDHDLGLNRWLAAAREEAYSDWLAWLLARMTIEELADVLGLPPLLNLGLDASSRSDRVRREVLVQQGHEGHMGRLDILLHVHDRAVIALELKRGTSDADTEKQLGYVRSIETDAAFAGMRKFYILLVTASDHDEVHGFEVRRYDRLCRNLRRLAKVWIEPHQSEHSRPYTQAEGLFSAAIMLAIIASIEINLLDMSLQKDSFTPATLSHLKEVTERSAYE